MILSKADAEPGFFARRGFWAGVALASPVYGEFVSWVWTTILVAPLVIFILTQRERLNWPHVSIAPMVGLFFLHLTALWLSHTDFQQVVIKDLIVALWLLLIFLFADRRSFDGFMFAVIPIATVAAMAGLAKAAMQDRGYLIGYILHTCDYYPAGSSLCVNYNNLGLVWMIAILGCIKFRWLMLIPVLATAGALVGSRRFLLLMMLLPFVWLLYHKWKGWVPLAVISVSSFVLLHVVSNSGFERFGFGAEPYIVVLPSINPNAIDSEGGDVSISRTVPSAMLGTMADGTFGTASRLDLWGLGVAQLGWLPKGWAYHEVFSCRFSDCTQFIYPHSPIISAWIAGGVVFGLVAVLFYVWPIFSIWRGGDFISLVLVVFATPYSAISGDTVFSLPVTLSAMLVGLSSLVRGEKGCKAEGYHG
jgi:hypothetical protein